MSQLFTEILDIRGPGKLFCEEMSSAPYLGLFTDILGFL